MHHQHQANQRTNKHLVRRDISGIAGIPWFPRIIARDVRVVHLAAITFLPLTFERTNEAHGGWAALHQIVAKVLTWQNLLPRPWTNDIVDPLTARYVHAFIFGSHSGI